ncbi:thioredoxin family protein [Flavobacterium filum]|uniref:thioredoxin family protein n=1 Tax=Flavobacterium TaxID=237 RepID=UPI0003F4E54C|nr:thioredoxin family protein [Flavobacterium filum]
MKKNLLFVLLLVNSLLIAQNWQTNFEEAKVLDQKENKNIVLVFSGSDWCAPCMKLEKNIWMSQEFQTESQNNWITYKADFPKKKANQLPTELTEQNKKLAEKYNKEGSFPLVVLLTPSGKVLGMFGFKNISPSDYIALIHSAEK